MRKPLVLYSIGERIGGQGLALVAQKAGEALFKKSMLDNLICYGYSKKNTSILKINPLHYIYFQPAKLFSFLPARYYYTMKRRWMDVRTSHLLKHSGANIFHGWTHSAIKSLSMAKQKGMITILERGNSHPLYTKKILKNEYEEYGIGSYHEIEKDTSLFKRFNLWRYEFNEALSEINNADYVFVNSEFCAKTYIKYGVSKNKIIVIPRGFDSKVYFPRAPQKKKEKFILLFMGNLHVRKGIKYILQAWAELTLKDAELWLVGNEADEVRVLLNQYKKKFNNIKTFGNVNNPQFYYQKASAFVFPSIDEGSAKVTYEAMASGLPCIITENSGCPVGREAAFIVPAKSSKSIAKYISILHKDVELRNLMGKKSRDHISEYTWENYQKKLIETYEKLLKRRGSKE